MWKIPLLARVFRDDITAGVIERMAAIRRLGFVEAREIAETLLKDSKLFSSIESPAGTLPGWLAPSIQELFRQYLSIELIGWATWLRRDTVEPSLIAPGFFSIGHSDLGGGDFDVCTRNPGDQIYDLDGSEQGQVEREALPSVYHWIILQSGQKIHMSKNGVP